MLSVNELNRIIEQINQECNKLSLEILSTDDKEKDVIRLFQLLQKEVISLMKIRDIIKKREN